MKVLFALNNDKVSEAIAKLYQNKYKEILSFKNVYYFNAIYKEIQRDKTYTRIVVSEDLEPFANNDYELIDKFLISKLETISKEVKNDENNEVEIILICNDRRTKSEDFLIKIFNMNIYNALIGNERKIDEICELLYSPRNQQEAQAYYEIEPEFGYQDESENSVSEAEMQNILEHYRRLGKNEDKYIDSFNNIISQYNDEQLKIIIKCLPINVRAVLESKSQKYQQLITFSNKKDNNDKKYIPKTAANIKKPISITMLKSESSRSRIKKPIIVPKSITIDDKTDETKTAYQPEIPKQTIPEIIKPQIDVKNEIIDVEPEIEASNNIIDIEPEIITENIGQQVDNIEQTKKGRGRPRKNPIVEESETDKTLPKRGRGRPKKEENIFEDIPNNSVESTKQQTDIENIDELLEGLPSTENMIKEDAIDLFELGNDINEDTNKNSEEAIDLSFLKPVSDAQIEKPELNKEETDLSSNSSAYHSENFQEMETTQSLTDIDDTKLKTKNNKIVAFLGTTKNGTSFVVNNTAEMLSSMGISTAVLDLTKTKNSYYIYTQNEETLREQTVDCIRNLENGIAKGIKINPNLTIYTELPTGNNTYQKIESILNTLDREHNVILIDCDFQTPELVFSEAQEIYLVQSMDVLTIQPLTAFLRDLKSKHILDSNKIKIIVNKYEKINSLSTKTLIGGIAFYNDPSMSFMTELFNKDNVEYFVIPFEVQNYITYLGKLAEAKTMSLKGYTKQFISSIRIIAEHVYPLINKNIYNSKGKEQHFSSKTNEILNEMKKNY